MPTPFAELLEKVRRHIEELHFEREPLGLYAPIRYGLSQGGKRLRPVLTLMTYNLYRDDTDRILDPAIGMEVFHNYTLLHDDVMDKADKRRGKPTVHKVWSENAAILSGDAMLVLAYRLISQCPQEQLPEVLRLFSETALEVCEGQQLDMEFEQRNDVGEDEYMEMIRLKTSVLLAGCARLGAMLAKAPADDAEYLYKYGVNIGLAFQLEDDLLDVYGDTRVFGKNIGGDIVSNKKTYLLIKALEHADSSQRAELNGWLSRTAFDREEKIAAVTKLYDQIGVRRLCERKIEACTRLAEDSLQAVGVPTDRKEELKKLMESLVNRKS